MTKDPVCDMTIDEKTAAGVSEHNGETYHFCSAMCKEWFDKEPERYLIPTPSNLLRAKRTTRIKSKQPDQSPS